MHWQHTQVQIPLMRCYLHVVGVICNNFWKLSSHENCPRWAVRQRKHFYEWVWFCLGTVCSAWALAGCWNTMSNSFDFGRWLYRYSLGKGASGHTMLSLDSSPLVIPLPAGRAPWSQREPSPPHALQSPHLPPPLPSPPYPASTSSNTPSQPYLFNQHLSSFDSSPRNYIVLYLLIWSYVSLTSSEVEGHEI